MKNNDSIDIQMKLDSPIEKVWDAWTNPEIILKWFGSDPNGHGLSATADVRPGGRFEISFANSDNMQYTCFGIYTDVVRFRKLAFTWEWKNEPGVQSIITVLLKPKSGFTQMLFEHADFGNESEHDYKAGWQATFSKLEQVIIRGNI